MSATARFLAQFGACDCETKKDQPLSALATAPHSFWSTVVISLSRIFSGQLGGLASVREPVVTKCA